MYSRRGTSPTSLIVLKIVFAVFFVSCKFGVGFEVSELQEFGERVRNLSLKLFDFTERDTRGNVFLAPFTIWNLMSLVAFSASADSWNQLYSTVGVIKQNEQNFNSIYKHVTNLLLREFGGIEFHTKLIVFYDANLEISRHFRKNILKSAAIFRVLYFDENISASKIANGFMQQPGDRSSKWSVFTTSDFEDSSMIVSGIVEFKGNWSLPFEESNTIIRYGYNSSVYMMRQRARVYYSDIKQLSASAMKLSYGDCEFSMIIIRPHESSNIRKVIRNLAKISIPDIFYQLFNEGLKEMDIELPKFSIISVLNLNNPFISMGITDIFVPQQANFSEISPSEDMYISNFEHRAVLKVSETGTIARAFTPGNLAKAIRKSQIGLAPPFLFLIVHGPTMSIVFCGKYGE